MANLQQLLMSSGKYKKKIIIEHKPSEFCSDKYQVCMVKNCSNSDFCKYISLKVKETNAFNQISCDQEANSSFTYTVFSPQTREFHHRWHTKRGGIIDCVTCYNISERSEPFAKHHEKNSERTNLVLTEDEKKKLLIVESKGVNTFVMSKDNPGKENMEFLSDTSVNGLPSILRLLFVKAEKLHVQVTFHIKIDSSLFIFVSTELAIEHHFDVSECIDMLFMMLLAKVKLFMCSSKHKDIDNFKIERLKVNIRMERYFPEKGVKKMSLPIKYRVKNAALEIDSEELRREHEQKESCDIDAITFAYTNYKATGNRTYLMRMKGANLYCFQLCQTSREIYTVPFYLTQPVGKKENRSFIILEDVEGKFQHFMEISNPQRFARTEDPKTVVTCPKCHTNYSELDKLVLHKSLNCGDSFEIFEADSDFVEEYSNNLTIETSQGKWLLTGLKEPDSEE